MGRHTLRRARLTLRRRLLIAWVDLRTSITHFLTPDAAAAGRVGGGRYIALCGAHYRQMTCRPARAGPREHGRQAARSERDRPGRAR